MTMRIQRKTGSAALIGSLACLASIFVAMAASAQMNPMMKEQLDRIPSGDEGVAQILGPMTERLKLSDEQVTEVRPIIVELVSDMQSAKSKLESGETTVMKFMMEMNMQGEAAAAEVEQHLDEAQLAEYASMREEQKLRMAQERRRAMQKMMKARQEAAAAAAASTGTP
jgi:hypothetical protein